MNIQEFKEKFKILITDDALFTALLVILVAITSFALGRISVGDSALFMQQQAAIHVYDAQNVTSSERQAETKQNSSAAGQFVGSAHSDKYHLPWCPGADRINEQNMIWFASKEEAHEAGYTPAANCPGLTE